MSSPVEVTVSVTQIGTGPVVPYSHGDGLRFYLTGLAEPRVCHPAGCLTTAPTAFGAMHDGEPGSLLHGKGFLIHEGADRRLGYVGGRIGCVEILDVRWNDFLAEIERLGGGTCEQIAARRALTVRIEHARYPDAVLRD